MSTLSLTNCICRALFSAVACDEAQDWARRIHLLMISGLHPLPWKNSRSLNVSLSLINIWIDGDFYFLMDAYSPIEPLEWHHFLLVPIVPFVPMDHWNCPLPSQTTWENNLTLLMRCIFTNRTIGIGCFSTGTNRTIGTNGPSELPCTQPHHMRK